ncbi:hypothetical protein J1605_022185 [Eschrichtius robustus]|uniref:Uncharacterized protein n=1 Tax=Eschrichtius robustus TaxID=9764 RepID=A0AB34HE29_ESCRO|nr:hypothetical protein J1605_022185 [Eschrichtius robustus]
MDFLVEDAFSGPKCPARPLPEAEGKREREGRVGQLRGGPLHGWGVHREPQGSEGVGWALGPNSTTPAPAARPPARPVIGLGGACARPGKAGRIPSERGAGGGGGGGGESGGREGANVGAGEPGSTDQRAGSERGGERRASWEGRKARLALRRRRPLHCALSGPPARKAPQPSGRKRRRQRPGRARSGSLTCRRPAGRAQGRTAPEEEGRPGRPRRSPAARERV